MILLKGCKQEDTSCGYGKDVHLFQMGQIIGKETSKEIAETTKLGLRTVRRSIKSWKDSEEPSSSRKKCGRINLDWSWSEII